MITEEQLKQMKEILRLYDRLTLGQKEDPIAEREQLVIAAYIKERRW